MTASPLLGATSGFPLLDLLTANSLQQQPERAAQQPEIADILSAPPDRPQDPEVKLAHSGSPSGSTSEESITESRGRTKSVVGNGKAASTSVRGFVGDKQKEEKFFPDRAPRPSQMLNPEATWRVITNVIPSDLMDTLVRCYVSALLRYEKSEPGH